MEILTRQTQDTVKGLLQRRIAALVGKHMDPEHIQPVLWQMVQDNVA